MKLYEAQPNSWIRILEPDITVAPGSILPRSDEALYFHHVDGMYSLCMTRSGEVVNLAAWTEVEPDQKP